jgi:hypothetical protein
MATVYIKPGTGSGSGTLAAPYFYDQLATAEAAAGPGGTILFTDGSYAGSTWDASGVTYESLNLHGAIITTNGIQFGASGVSVTVKKFKIAPNATERADVYASTTIDQCHALFTNSFIFNIKSAGGKITNTLIENNVTDTSYAFRLGRAWNSLSEFTSNTYFVTGLNGAGVTNIDFFTSGPTVAKNCIFMSDDTANTVITSAENTAASSTNCCFFQFGSGNTSGGTNNVFADPLFVDATSDYRLRPSSPCINAGTAS